MELSNLFLFSFHFLLLTTTGYLCVEGSPGHSRHRRHHHHHNRHHHNRHHLHDEHQLYGFRPTKLFVFGDSYADTGNVRKSLANSWKEPYGTTFPGKPAGRFSDGRVLTDYLAKYLGLKSPIAYTWMKMGDKKLKYGMNFAYGGSGVFHTYNLLPNMSTQIDFFDKLTMNNVYSKWDLQSSLVLVALAGNDYAAYLANNGTAQGLQSFIPLVINQLVINLKRLHEMGARKIAVTALEPLGCLPQMTKSSWFNQCNGTQNMAVKFHNLLLQQAVEKLNNETRDSSFFVLDLYDSFTTVLQEEKNHSGSVKFETPLRPCCMGLSNGYLCGSVDENGAKMYTVCNDPKAAFFWDGSHPTEAGWQAVFTTLQPTFKQFFF